MNKVEKLLSQKEKLEQDLAEVNVRDERLEQIKKVRRDLGEHLADGANDCKNCGYPPVGMIKTPSYYDPRNDVQMPPVFEVGCIICPPFYVTREDGEPRKLDGKKAKVKRRSYSARATTQEEAVQKWNSDQFVEDTKLELNIPAKERARLA